MLAVDRVVFLYPRRQVQLRLPVPEEINLKGDEFAHPEPDVVAGSPKGLDLVRGDPRARLNFGLFRLRNHLSLIL